jgi:hypothetical protein
VQLPATCAAAGLGSFELVADDVLDAGNAGQRHTPDLDPGSNRSSNAMNGQHFRSSTIHSAMMAGENSSTDGSAAKTE